MDALDEADPLEQQQQLQPKKVCVKACGNWALCLAIACLVPKLPSCVRFVFTARPDAVCGGIQQIMERAFTAQCITFMKPHELRDDELDDKRVLVVDTVVSECGLAGINLGAASGLPALYMAYTAAFDKSPPSDQATALLEVLMVAQEPLPYSLLQEMGLAVELERLPCWRTLFFLADHHVYVLHKSLSDWLLEATCKYAVDVGRGHKLLGIHLLKDVLREDAQPNAYAAKYIVMHLAEAGEVASASLDAVLASWEFLRQVFREACGSYVVRALGGMVSPRTTYAEDTLRWMRRCFNSFEKRPEDMEAITLAKCPVNSIKYREAAARAQPVWLATKVFGGDMGNWTLDLAVLKVRLVYIYYIISDVRWAHNACHPLYIHLIHYVL
jgi:hypothetical protein